jgi:hypothetical protein
MVQSVGLGIQVPDFGGSLARGMQLRAAGEQRENENMLRAMLADPATAQGVLSGDPTMLARLAGMGTQGLQVAAPLMAQAGQRQYQQERLAMDRERLAQEIEHRRASLAQAASAQNADPAAIREWRIFQAMTPEQQSQYLLMKRAQPMINTGTEFVRPDPLTAQPAASVPINIRGREVETALGKAEGQSLADAPAAIRDGRETMRLIDGVRNHPALRSATGVLSFTQAIRGTPMFDLGQRVRQLEGRAFLAAYESLKGGGQITEIEGTKATQAQARLNSAQSATDYLAALGEMHDLLRAAEQENIERLRAAGRDAPAPRQIGAQPQAPRLEIEQRPAAPPPAPRIGEMQDGWRFMGGDPAQASSWQRAR